MTAVEGIAWDANKKTNSNILEAIGKTPLVRLNRVSSGVEAQLLINRINTISRYIIFIMGIEYFVRLTFVFF